MKDKKDYSNGKFIRIFKSEKDENTIKILFRELFENRKDLKFESDLSQEFKTLSTHILPQILASKFRTKNAYEILQGAGTTKSYDKAEDKMPYLLRQSNEDEPIGIVRLTDCTKNNGKFEYKIYDYIPFIINKVRKLDCKFNSERMQMFSVVYRSWESWNQPDTDDEYIREVDLNKMVKQVAETGIDLDIEHEPDTNIRKTDARVIEFYQARTNWMEGGLDIRKGDVVATTQFYDTARGRQLWDDAKGGEFTTYSIEGSPEHAWERENENE